MRGGTPSPKVTGLFVEFFRDSCLVPLGILYLPLVSVLSIDTNGRFADQFTLFKGPAKPAFYMGRISLVRKINNLIFWANDQGVQPSAQMKIWKNGQ